MTNAQSRKGLFASLFDFSFTEFVTPRIIKLLYGLAIAGAALWSLSILAFGPRGSIWSSLMTLILSVLAFLFLVIIARIWLEIAIVFFRIADNTAEIAEHDAAIALNTAERGASSTTSGTP